MLHICFVIEEHRPMWQSLHIKYNVTNELSTSRVATKGYLK